MNVLAVDPSMSNCGFTFWIDGTCHIWGLVTSALVHSLSGKEYIYVIPSVNNHLVKAEMITFGILHSIDHPIHVLCLEGHAYQSFKTLHVAEFVGVIKYLLYKEANIENMLIVPPPTLKKFATGYGRASKTDICKQFVKECGFEPVVSDIADAYFLGKYAYVKLKEA